MSSKIYKLFRNKYFLKFIVVTHCCEFMTLKVVVYLAFNNYHLNDHKNFKWDWKPGDWRDQIPLLKEFLSFSLSESSLASIQNFTICQYPR